MTTSNWRGNGESSTSILAPLGPNPEQRRGDDDLPEGRFGPVYGSATLRPLELVETRIMKPAQRLTAIIEREDDGFVALCPELDVASQGTSIEDARGNLIEALTLFFEVADKT